MASATFNAVSPPATMTGRCKLIACTRSRVAPQSNVIHHRLVRSIANPAALRMSSPARIVPHEEPAILQRVPMNHHDHFRGRNTPTLSANRPQRCPSTASHATAQPSSLLSIQLRECAPPQRPQTLPLSPASPATSPQSLAPSPNSRTADSSHKTRTPRRPRPPLPQRARPPDSSSRKSSPKS